MHKLAHYPKILSFCQDVIFLLPTLAHKLWEGWSTKFENLFDALFPKQSPYKVFDLH